ncbi:PUA-like domain-containing protein [Auriculariales sp. MPI-PUGE-AT-0066]|nr:PUA-like domain-containing protein [Auriculariales sp. MPI-PUGE-AT-0066]
MATSMSLVRDLIVCARCGDRSSPLLTLDCGHSVCTSHPRCVTCPPVPPRKALANGVQYFAALLPHGQQSVPPHGTDVVLSHVIDLCHREPDDWQECLRNDLLPCPVCTHLLCDPITTPCQHTFCADCLERCLDSTISCPICRQSIPGFSFFSKHPRNQIIHSIVATVFPDTLAQRRLAIAAARQHQDQELDVPIFRCSLAFPGLPTYLHIFEPRYRLLIRRCLSNDTPQFGMMMHPHSSSNLDDNTEPSNYGSMLHIRSVQMFPDGRSMVESIGVFRFRLLATGTHDGYQVGKIQRIDDIPDLELLSPNIVSSGGDDFPASVRNGQPTESATLRALSPRSSLTAAELMARCRSFLNELRHTTAPWVTEKLEGAYGPPPEDVATFSYWVALVLPLPEHERARLLPMRSARERLEIIIAWIESVTENSHEAPPAGCIVS